MSKLFLSGVAPIAWLCALCLLLGVGCASSMNQAEQALRVKQGDAHYKLGLDYIRNQRVALGLGELLQAERFDPINPEIQQALAYAYMIKRKPDKAEYHYLRTLEIEPASHEARLNLSVLYTQLNRYEDSLTHTSMLVEDATFPDPYLGILEAEEGRRLEGITFFRQVLEQEPGLEIQAQANCRIGEIYISLGERKRAIEHLRAAVAQSPGGPWGEKSEGHLILLR